MKRLVAALLLPLIPACSLEEHTVRRTIQVDDRDRVYLLHVPPTHDKEKPAALIFALHGGATTAKQMERFSKFSPLSDKEGFIVVYPDAVGRNWNDGRGDPKIPSQQAKIDDVKFISSILDELAKEYRIDEGKVFATGPSNGGIFSQYLAIKLSDRIAAIGCVIGSIGKPAAKEFKPEKPVSILIMNGTEDRLVPFDGGKVARNRGEVIGTREAAKMWVRHNGCGEEPEKVEIPDRDRRDGCTVTRETWSGGKDGTEVVLYTVQGGGHTWPGGRQYAPRFIIGRVCRDFDASEVIWEFFQKHPRKKK